MKVFPEQPIDEIRTGDVLAFYGRGLVSRLIQLRTCDACTHIGFAVWIMGRLAVIEAREGRGVRVFPIDRYLKAPDLRIDWLRLLDDDYEINRAVVVSEAWSHWGKRYASPLQFLRSWGLISRRMADRLGFAPDTNDERFFCSEFVLHCLREGGYKGNGILFPAQASPGDVRRLACLRFVRSINYEDVAA